MFTKLINLFKPKPVVTANKLTQSLTQANVTATNKALLSTSIIGRMLEDMDKAEGDYQAQLNIVNTSLTQLNEQKNILENNITEIRMFRDTVNQTFKTPNLT